jgi:threonine/homoserine/homoserine lactone efflux protein
MINAFFSGLLLGLPLAISIGPSFFALIQTSIKSGFRSAFALASGIIISDFICIVIAYFGASQLFNDPQNKTIIGIAGGIVLVVFGVFNFFQKQQEMTETLVMQTLNIPLTMVKGFIMNILNPFVILFWVGAVTLVSSKYDFSTTNVVIFFSATLFVVFASDIIKAFVANRIREYLRPRVLLFVNRVAAAFLIIFGLILIYRVIEPYL